VRVLELFGSAVLGSSPFGEQKANMIASPYGKAARPSPKRCDDSEATGRLAPQPESSQPGHGERALSPSRRSLPLSRTAHPQSHPGTSNRLEGALEVAPLTFPLPSFQILACAPGLVLRYRCAPTCKVPESRLLLPGGTRETYPLLRCLMYRERTSGSASADCQAWSQGGPSRKGIARARRPGSNVLM
jgi:hypothetical protein